MKYISHIIAAGIALGLFGCSTSGLPHGAQVVGGGLMIEWTPPASESGTAILVEKTSGKPVMTKRLTSVDRGFTFDFANPHDAAVLRAAFGGSAPTNAQYVLYFVRNDE